MRTLKPITDDEVKWLMTEPQADLSYLLHGVLTTVCLPARIVKRITIDHLTGCWRVGGHGSGNGYAKLSIGSRDVSAHRAVYEILVGKIPEGHLLDHKVSAGCNFRDCANPHHLEPVTTKENTTRGKGVNYQFRKRRMV